MGTSNLILHKYQVVNEGKFAISLKVFEVENDPKHPEGVKTSFVLIDLELGKPVLLIDNHEPFGFHMHTDLPEDKNVRESLDVENYRDALEVFMREVRRRIEFFEN